MPDIAMCKGMGCIQRDRCHRFTAEYGFYQSFFMESPLNDDGSCDHFWDNTGHKIRSDIKENHEPEQDKKD